MYSLKNAIKTKKKNPTTPARSTFRFALYPVKRRDTVGGLFTITPEILYLSLLSISISDSRTAIVFTSTAISGGGPV